jgi:hypothetical protein
MATTTTAIANGNGDPYHFSGSDSDVGAEDPKARTNKSKSTPQLKPHNAAVDKVTASLMAAPASNGKRKAAATQPAWGHLLGSGKKEPKQEPKKRGRKVVKPSDVACVALDVYMGQLASDSVVVEGVEARAKALRTRVLEVRLCYSFREPSFNAHEALCSPLPPPLRVYCSNFHSCAALIRWMMS